MRLVSLILASLVWFAPLPALAGDNAGVHEHDELLVRVSLGGGFTAGWAPSSDHALALLGASSLLNISAGFAVVENLVVNVDLFGAVLPAADTRPGDDWSALGDDAELLGAGLGITWYWMPHNILLAASGGWSAWQGNAKSTQGVTSKGGPAINLLAGKEWWTARNWGLGVAANVLLASTGDAVLVEEGVGRLYSLSAGLVVTLTYN